MKHFLSEEECDHLISAAKTEGLIDSATEKNSDNRDPRNFVLMDVNEDKQLSIEEVSYCLPNECTCSYKHTPDYFMVWSHHIKIVHIMRRSRGGEQGVQTTTPSPPLMKPQKYRVS